MVINGKLHAPADLTLDVRAPVPNEIENGWASEMIRTLWSKELTFDPAKNRRLFCCQ
jgi:hypothetical protein